MENEQRTEAMIAPLTEWYRSHGRTLPWRENPTPYHVWISEIMLQQTRIEAVIPYYTRFLSELPTVAALAAVEDDRLMKLWEGLGYYSRARNLKKAALLIMEQYGGELPADTALLRTLPGIGDYTAGAIASIAFGLPEPAVDGNVLRVMTRLLCDTSDVLKPATKVAMTDLLRRHYPDGKKAALLTEGIMELGETVCLPNGAPVCDLCPIRMLCLAETLHKTDEIPYRAPKPVRKIISKTIFLLHCGERYTIRRREEKGLLAGTFEFPSTDAHLTEGEAKEYLLSQGITPMQIMPAPKSKHIFSHLEWHMQGISVEVDREADGYLWVVPEEIRHRYAVATAFRAYTDFLSAPPKKQKKSGK